MLMGHQACFLTRVSVVAYVSAYVLHKISGTLLASLKRPGPFCKSALHWPMPNLFLY